MENKTKDTAAAEKFYGIAKDYASKAAAILPDNYKPVKFDGDIALQKAAEADVASAAVPYYQKAIDLLRGEPKPRPLRNRRQDHVQLHGATIISTRRTWPRPKSIL